MNVLGIGHDLWISAAALVRDGDVVAAICEERLNRLKGYKGFPKKAIEYCLREGGIRIDDVDLITVGWNPAWHMESPHPRFSAKARWRSEYLYAIPNYVLPMAENFPFGPVEQRFEGLKAPLIYVDHQLAHAANGYYLSPFSEAAVYSADGRGERHTALLGVCGQEGIKALDYVLYPHSLGLFYGLFTQYLGFSPHSDEWKVMALASYGSEKGNRFYPTVRKMVTVKSNGGFKLDLAMCGYLHADSYGERFYTDEFIEAVGIKPRKRGEPLTTDHQQLAWALQRVFEETVSECLTILHHRTNMDNVVVSGGCMMNSVFNGMITSKTPFKRAYISSCPDDSGVPVGSALWGYHEYYGKPRKSRHSHNYWGPGFDDEIEETLKKYRLTYTKLDNAPRTAAELIAGGKLVGWFRGRMEFGQRALGNRSILADPRHADIRDMVNRAVKYRESFRPFAPSILAEKAADYFNLEGGGKVPFMERVYKFKKEVQKKVPAVVHIDGTGRLQTVEKDDNPAYYALISEFEKITGIPIVLNTSFNLNGEPIVCSPTDAIRTFFSCGLDVLILGDFMLRKE